MGQPALTDTAVQALDLLEHPVWVYALDTRRILASNAAARRWLGYSDEQLRALTIDQLRPPEEREALRRLVASFTGSSLDAGRWTILDHDGRPLRVHFHWRRVQYGDTPAALATITDETDLCRARDAAAEAGEQLATDAERHRAELARERRLLGSIPGSFVVVDADHFRITAVSDEYAQAAAVDRDTLLGRPLDELLSRHPDGASAPAAREVLASLQRTAGLRRTETMALQRYPLRRPDGSREERYWLPVNKPVFDAGNRVTHVIHRVEDVTPFVQATAGEKEAPSAGIGAEGMVRQSQQLRHALDRLNEQDLQLGAAERLLALGRWEMDLESGIMDWSPRVFQILGIPPDRAALDYAAYVEQVVHPEDRDRIRAEYRRFLDGDKSQLIFRHRIRTPGGSVRHLQSVAERRQRRTGATVVGFVQDVSDLWRTEQAMSTAQELLRVAGEQGRLGGWRVDLKTRELTWTPGTAHIHGLPETAPPDLERIFQTFLPGHREKLQHAFTRCETTGQPYDEVCELVNAQGRRLWVRAWGRAVRDGDGEIIAVQGALQDITDLQAAEQRAEALEGIEDAFFSVDRGWHFTYLNEAAEALLGSERETLLGRTVWDAFPEAADSEFRAAYQQAMDTGETIRVTAFYAPFQKWFDAHAYPLSDGLAVTFRDATEAQARTERLRLLESAAERLNDMLVITEADSIDEPHGPKIVYVNDAFVRTTGYRREEAIGSTPRMLQGPKTDRATLDRIRSALEAWRPIAAELVNYTRCGEPFDLELDIVPITDGSGSHTHFVAVQRDVTERNRAIVGARESSERFRLLTLATDDVVWDWDLARNSIWWSEALHTTFGYRESHRTGSARTFTERIHPADRKAVMDSLRAAIDTRDTRWRREYRFLHAGGRVARVVDRCYILRNEAGSATRLIGSLTDVTEQRQLEARLREAQKLEAVGQLTGGVAHDFNNLLTVMLGNAEELVDALEDAPPLQRMAAMTVTAASRGAELTNRLLAFSRRQALEPAIVDLRDAIRGMEAMLRRTLPESIDLETRHQADLWPAFVDPGQLQTALLNLALNARDAMPAGGELTIETGNARLDTAYAEAHEEVVAGDYAMICVTDNGLGMSPETVERAFEPFYTTKEAGAGSGLGLSMVFGFVKQSGGHASIYSEPGEGTTVRLYFPRAEGATEAIPPGDPQAVVGGTEYVLVVEDDALVREHLAERLHSLGYRVQTAENAARALEIIAEDPVPDLMITDIVMPGGMNGRQLADRARGVRPGMRILFTSGYTEDAIVHNGLFDRGVEFLGKPYTKEVLAAKLRAILDEP